MAMTRSVPGRRSRARAASFATSVRERIDSTLFVDTHEHLVEEATRIDGAGTHPLVPCSDAALLLWDYAQDDLAVAGMPASEIRRLFSPDVAPGEKWAMLSPYWERCAATGPFMAVRLTANGLFGERTIDGDSFVRISEQMLEGAQGGLYRSTLRAAGVETCQVNSLEAIYCVTDLPDLLYQDICISWLSHGPDLADLALQTGIAASSLDEMHAVIDWFFIRYGRDAVAVKSLGAYQRRLDYVEVGASEAAPIFASYARGEALSPDLEKRLQDHLMHYCISRATEYDLPVKLHCGAYGGHDLMPLERVRQNAADVCGLLVAHPDTRFVLMHMGYPYQAEFMALAKHYTNAYVDLCWAWIASPLAARRFVSEFLVTAPSNKLLTFGGDYQHVEPIVGHAELARRGLEQALTDLHNSGWLSEADALALVPRLMRGNALAVFPRLTRRADEESPSAHGHG